MLSIDFIRDNKDKVLKAAKNKGYDKNGKFVNKLNELLKLDEQWRQILQVAIEINKKRNIIAHENIKVKENINIEIVNQARDLKKKIKQKEDEKSKIEERIDNLSYEIPNLHANDVKVGKDESENEVIKKYKEPSKFSFKPKDHLELGKDLDIIDVERAVKISGSRFGYLKNEAVLLEFALIQFALKILTAEGFVPIVPPVLIKHDITQELGYWQAGGEKDYYSVQAADFDKGLGLGFSDKLYLVGTAEHSIVPMHKNEVFKQKDLPKRYVGFSTAFRQEAGSYGKDVKGIFRVHQFDKVEMVSFTTEEEDDKEHEYLLSLEEKLFQALDIPYQVVKMCTGDLGFPVARKYDIEAWIPSQNKYREVTSTSTTTDFQARRLNIKYRDGNEKKFVRILNGTAFAIGRTLIAILENFQQKDGSVKIPKVLQPLTGFSEIKRK